MTGALPAATSDLAILLHKPIRLVGRHQILKRGVKFSTVEIENGRHPYIYNLYLQYLYILFDRPTENRSGRVPVAPAKVGRALSGVLAIPPR